MNRLEALAEIEQHLVQLKKLGGGEPSLNLRELLDGLHKEFLTKATQSQKPKLKVPRSKSPTARSKKDPEAVAKTISELSARLKAAFSSDETFERTVKDVESSGLTKERVIELYQAVFDNPRSFPKSVTKKALLDAIRKDRIAKVRAAS